ncbi:MAG: TonB family protein [Verrucomicrobia bacterium]|nr:TonB family protein [Verrucomicrobiota bacterium]
MATRFWRNVTLIAFAHVALLLALWHHASGSRVAVAPEVSWLSPEESPEQELPEATPAPTQAPAEAKSEIEVPQSTPAPKPKAAPPPRKRSHASPSPPRRSTERKGESAKERKSKKPVLLASKSATRKPQTGSAGQGNGDDASANWYGDMLHDRFYRAWTQPQSVVASGAKFSALARIRIEKDGRVSGFKVVQPSGNVLVDQSVREVGGKVRQVDALPPGIGSSGHYDVNINFELNPK